MRLDPFAGAFEPPLIGPLLWPLNLCHPPAPLFDGALFTGAELCPVFGEALFKGALLPECVDGLNRCHPLLFDGPTLLFDECGDETLGDETFGEALPDRCHPPAPVLVAVAGRLFTLLTLFDIACRC